MISDQFHQVRTKRHQLWPMKRTLSGPRWYFQPPKLWKIILYLKATQSVVFCYFTPTELRQMGKPSLKRCTYFETQRMKRILAYKEWGEERSRQWKGMIKDPELGKFLGCSRSWDSVTVEGIWEEQGRELKMRLARGQGQSGKALLATARCLNRVLSTVESL